MPGKSHGWRSLIGCSPWGRYKLDTTERLHVHFWLSCIGEGNGNPLQCSCLENPRDGGAWQPAVYGVAQSRTRLKRLSSSSSSSNAHFLVLAKAPWVFRMLLLEGAGWWELSVLSLKFFFKAKFIQNKNVHLKKPNRTPKNWKCKKNTHTQMVITVVFIKAKGRNNPSVPQ